MEPAAPVIPSMFPKTGSLPGSALYQRLVRGSINRSKPDSNDPTEIDDNLEEGAEPGLLGSSHSVRTDDYVFFVRCYGFCNLPQPSRCFLTVKTTRDVAENRPARAGTMASLVARNFVWQEPFTVDIGRRERSSSPGTVSAVQQPLGLFISLIDSAKKAYIGRCIIPVDRFVAGEQYNLSLVLDQQRQSYVLLSILLHPSLSFQTSLFLKYTDLCRLEVFLHGVRRPRASGDDSESPPQRHHDGKRDLHHPFGSNVIAALHVEDDFNAYLRRIQDAPPKAPFQAVSLVSADAPLRVKPTVYQISPPSQLSLHPQWHCLLEFTLTTDEISTPTGAVVVELFDMDFPKDGVGAVRFCGWAAVPLRSLARQGLRDGDIVSESAILHNLPHGPTPKAQAGSRRAGLLRKSGSSPPPSSLLDCEYSNSCSRHDYTIAMQSRRWVSRSFVRHLLRIQSEGAASTTGPLRSRDLSDIPPGSGLSNGASPAPLLRSQSHSNSQSIIDWAANRKKQPPASPLSALMNSNPMSNSSPNLPGGTPPVPKQRRPSASAASPASISPYLSQQQTASNSSPILHVTSPAPMLRNKSKSSAVIVTEKPASASAISQTPPSLLSRVKQMHHPSPQVPPRLARQPPKQPTIPDDSDEYKSFDEAPDASPPDRNDRRRLNRSSSSHSNETNPHASDEEEDAPANFSSKTTARGRSESTDDEDLSDEEEMTVDSEIIPRAESPSIVELPPRRRASPEVPPVAGTRAPVASTSGRSSRSNSTSTPVISRHAPPPIVVPVSPVIVGPAESSRSRANSTSSASGHRVPLHVVVDPHARPPSASPSPKSPTGHAVPLGQFFRAGSARTSESSNSDSEGEPTQLHEMGFISTPPGSPLQLMNVLTKLERMLTKKLQKKKKTINELRDHLSRTTEDATRLRAETSILQGQNQVLREEMERLRRERDTYERRASDAQLQFRQFVKSMQQNARSAGVLSSAASSVNNSWNSNSMRLPNAQSTRRQPSYDGYSEDDTSDFEPNSPQRPAPQRPPRQAPAMNPVATAEVPSLLVEVGSLNSLPPGDTDDSGVETDTSARADLSFQPEYTEDFYDDGSVMDQPEVSSPPQRQAARQPAAPRPVPSRPPIKQSNSFSSAGSSNSSKSRDSMVTFPGSVGSNKSLSSPRVANLPNWSDDDGGDMNRDEIASNSSKEGLLLVDDSEIPGGI